MKRIVECQGYSHTYGYLGNSCILFIDRLIPKHWLDYDETLRMHSILPFRDTDQVHRGGGGSTLHVIYNTQMSSQMFPNEMFTPETLIKTSSLLGYDAWLNCYVHL